MTHGFASKGLCCFNADFFVRLIRYIIVVIVAGIDESVWEVRMGSVVGVDCHGPGGSGSGGM